MTWTPIKALVAKPVAQSVRARNLKIRWAVFLGGWPCDRMERCQIESNGRCQICW